MSASKASLSWWAGACVVAVVVAVMSLRVGAPDRHAPTVDLIDEGAHYAYVVALQHHHLPAWGDTLDQGTLRMEDCLGVAGHGLAGCDARPRQPSGHGALGYSYEAQQPPLGYLPYVLTTDAGAPPRDALASARHGGMVWVVVTAALLVLVAAVEGMSLLGLVLLEATCLLSPIFVHAAATVNNDSAGIAAGALALLAAALVRPGWRPLAGLGVGLGAGIIVGMIKGVYAVVPLALVLAAVAGDPPSPLGLRAVRALVWRNTCVLGMLAGSVAAYLGWTVWQDARGRVPSSVVLHALRGHTQVSHLRLSSMARGLEKGMSLLIPYYDDVPVHVVWDIVFFGAVTAVVVLGVRGERARAARALALGALGGLVALAVGWTVLNDLEGHYDAYASARYALPLLPVLAIVVVRAAGRVGLVTLGVALPASAVLWQLTEGPT